MPFQCSQRCAGKGKPSLVEKFLCFPGTQLIPVLVLLLLQIRQELLHLLPFPLLEGPLVFGFLYYCLPFRTDQVFPYITGSQTISQGLVRPVRPLVQYVVGRRIQALPAAILVFSQPTPKVIINNLITKLLWWKPRTLPTLSVLER